MKKGKLFYIAFILLLLSGCTRDVLETLGDAPLNKDGSIAFRMDSIQTRGTPHDNLTAYDKVNLMVYSHAGNYADDKSLYRQTILNKNTSNTPPAWDYSPPIFWPDGSRLSFLAYTIESNIAYVVRGQEGVCIKENSTTKVPDIEYFVPTDVKKQPDLLVTAQLDHPKVQNVTLDMKHALSCVSFCAPLSAGVTTMKVKNIRIKNIYTKGTLSLDDPSMTWKLDEASKSDLIVREPGIDPDKPLVEDPANNNNYLMTPDGYLMMLPQTLKNTVIDVTYLVDGKEKKNSYTLPTEVVWKPGKKYIYKFGEDLEEIVVYYEKYADGTLGLHTHAKADKIPASLNETKIIVEAGYGILTKSKIVSTNPTIKLGNGNAIQATKIASVDNGYDLYTVNQTGSAGLTTFVLPPKTDIVAVYFDGNSVACGNVTPHFAKGVHNEYNLSEYAIRTPQQMRNISALTTPSENLNDTDNPSCYRTYKQERDLDFSATNIGGGTLSGSVVDDVFAGTFNADPAKSISNLTISSNLNNVGLFAGNNWFVNDITLKASTITGGSSVGGIAGSNLGGGKIVRARVIGIDNTTGAVTISGASQIGGLAGINKGVITGNDAEEKATEITVAEISGWVNITGTGNQVGGIVGHNAWGSVNKTLVNGVYVTGTSLGALTHSKIYIKGASFVGGIAGQNDVEINGNVMGTGAAVKNMPDVAGIVEIQGGNWVGGITGINAATGKLNSVNIRLGRTPAMIINGTGSNIGGIVGENSGTLGVQSNNTFISIRGNIVITGVNNVGGIVGKNSSSATLENCFVYNFYTQTDPKIHYAPQITSTNDNAGGIAGENEASIVNSSVFSADKNTLLSITANNNAGGIVGSNKSGGKTENCSMIGQVEVKVGEWRQASGGIAGDNKSNTTITKCWVGSTDGYGIIANAEQKMGLVIAVPGNNASFGTPTITGGLHSSYIGGAVGLNDGGIIDGMTLNDNVTIGRKSGTAVDDGSNWVGGITGGNAQNSFVRNCTVANSTGKSITIQGARNLGGIVGLNNGIVESCQVSGTGDNALRITGLGTMGGIVGQGGGNAIFPGGTGNDNTVIQNCSVTGYVTIEGNPNNWGSAVEVGGIIGLNGVAKDNKNNISGCVVRGAAAQSIKISVFGTAGGIAGKNSGNIYRCDVQNALIESKATYAGGITGLTITNASTTSATGYRSDIKACNVYSGVRVLGPTDAAKNLASGALVGYINSSVTMNFGEGAANINWVSNTGVQVNTNTPTNNSYIFGYNTGDGGIIKANINHTVTATPPAR